MGAAEIFTNAANLEALSTEPLKVSQVKQKAIIEVNEQGTEAAAVSGEFFNN